MGHREQGLRSDRFVTANRVRRWDSDAGFSMIATVLSMVATALLVLLLLGTTLHSGSTSNTSISNAPGVGQAEDLLAQQSLSTGLTSVATLSAGGAGSGEVSAASLSAANPSISFVSGPSSGPSTVSVAVADTGVGGVSGVSGVSGVGGIVGGTGNGAGASSVTLAARSSDGICWLVWRGGSTTFYGAQTHQSTCTAPAITAAPVPGPVSSSTIGWQPGGFPTA
ncbi:MAG: hypothetical protein ABSC90_12815 [Acidimicrobiales bacterium]|jgi:hypothetical protein